MAKCGQACPYNTLDGCKVKEHNAICPLTNMVTPITEYQMTNADRIRAMSDEELAEYLSGLICDINEGVEYSADLCRWMEWLEKPAKEECV